MKFRTSAVILLPEARYAGSAATARDLRSRPSSTSM